MQTFTEQAKAAMRRADGHRTDARGDQVRGYSMQAGTLRGALQNLCQSADDEIARLRKQIKQLTEPNLIGSFQVAYSDGLPMVIDFDYHEAIPETDVSPGSDEEVEIHGIYVNGSGLDVREIVISPETIDAIEAACIKHVQRQWSEDAADAAAEKASTADWFRDRQSSILTDFASRVLVVKAA